LNARIGACGIYCGFCSTFRFEKNRCFGCDWGNRKLREKRKTHKGCVFWECAQDKNVKSCFLCEKFPCKMHYDKRAAVYTEQALDMWKEFAKTGLTAGVWEALTKRV